MSIRRAIQFVLLASAVAACRSHPVTSPDASAAKPAPRVAIHASVTGGGIHRQVSADFASDRDAYVLVGHVGGDGRLRVLFPDNAGQRGFIRAGTKYLITAFPADVDANPSLYSLTRPPQRNAGARMDSYDGLGSAFIFVISSAQPLALDDIADDDGSFSSEIMPTYWYEPDPRQEIDRFARDVSGGRPYKLQYAYSYSTTRYSSLTDRMLDCAAADFSFGGANSWYSPMSRPWVWTYFGNDLGFWNLYDDYAGLPACAHSAWLPGVYAFNVEPIQSQRPKVYVRVLHRPLVPDQEPIAYRSRLDRSADQDPRRAASRSGDYSNRRSSPAHSGTSSRPSAGARPAASAPRPAPAPRSQPPHKQ